MGHIFRTDRNMSDANERATILDRAWAATQPPELSAAESDQLWAEVVRACDHPPTLKLEPSTQSRRLTVVALVTLGLAQAAAIVLAVGLTVRPDPKHPIQLAQVEPNPTPVTVPQPIAPAALVVTRHDVEPYETFIVSINDKGFVGEERIQPKDSGSTLAYVEVPANNASDMLGRLESLSP
jgi:hypothetical protein